MRWRIFELRLRACISLLIVPSVGGSAWPVVCALHTGQTFALFACAALLSRVRLSPLASEAVTAIASIGWNTATVLGPALFAAHAGSESLNVYANCLMAVCILVALFCLMLDISSLGLRLAMKVAVIASHVCITAAIMAVTIASMEEVGDMFHGSNVCLVTAVCALVFTVVPCHAISRCQEIINLLITEQAASCDSLVAPSDL
mmetsp:Transcript_60405/g.155689  ORF Transcript_60405/g.155689 Transcript_60405/m.155689 type:complete len:203 (+) Transcript_60405:115-723(+)